MNLMVGVYVEKKGMWYQNDLLPQRPTNNDVSFDSDSQGAINRSSLGRQTDGVNPWRDVRKNLVKVPARKIVFGVAINSWEAANNQDTLAGIYSCLQNYV